MTASVLGTGESIGFSPDGKEQFFDFEVEIDGMLHAVQKMERKIFLGIDDVSRTKEMAVRELFDVP